MRGVTVGAFGDPEYVKSLGKASTTSDIALSSFKEGDVNVSLVAPVRYPDKVQPLSYAALAADAGLVVVSALTREVGETILALDAAGVTQGLIVLRNYLQPDQIAPLLEGTALEQWEVSTDDREPQVRQTLAGFEAPVREGDVRIPVDHHFDVKGIGTVVLGFVKQGVVKKHEQLRLYPSLKKAQIRSIQVHDVDVDEATPGDHVGLALKQVESDDVDRGQVLAPEGTLEVVQEKKVVPFTVRVNRFFKAGLETGRVYYLGMGMQVVPVRLAEGTAKAGEEKTLHLEAVKPWTYGRGEHGVLIDLDAQGNRVVGRATPREYPE